MSTTCKFFLQGTCKFGDSCKFSHQINDTNQSQGTSVMMRQQSKPPAIDTNLLIKSVITDMNNAEKGGHWLLSSYAPFKDKPWFPGFENRSFEEVRCGYYEARKNGTVEQYKAQLQSALQDAAMKMKALQNPTNQIVHMLIQIYNAAVTNQYPSAVPAPTSPPNPTFVQNQQQNSSIFAVANQKLFGNTPQSQQPSIFAGSQTNASNVYMGAQPGTSTMFSSALPNTANKNIFSGGQSVIGNQPTFAASQNNTILRNQSPFGGQNQNTTFATRNNFPPSNNTFSPQMQNSPFSVPTHTNSPFNQGQPSNSSIFPTHNQQPNYGNMINPNAQTPFAGQVQQSIFANTSPQQTTYPSSPSQQTAFSSMPSQQTAFPSTPSQQTTFPSTPSQQTSFPSTPPQQTTYPSTPSQQTTYSTPPQQTTYPTTLPQQTTYPSTLPQQTSYPFAQQQPGNPATNLFNMPTTMFGGQTSIFSNQPATTGQKLTNSIFAQGPPNNVFAQTAQVTSSEAYSRLEDLNDDDIKSFESDNFEFGKIPEKPPTAQMCL